MRLAPVSSKNPPNRTRMRLRLVLLLLTVAAQQIHCKKGSPIPNYWLYTVSDKCYYECNGWPNQKCNVCAFSKIFWQKLNLRRKAWFQRSLLRQGEETPGQVALPPSRSFWEIVIIPSEIKPRLFFINRKYMFSINQFQVYRQHPCSLPKMRWRVC